MKPRPSLLIFLLSWLVINLIQAGFTGLFNDEAYYFFYSRELAWGYYDHPPFVALLIRLGYAIFHNELGIRLLFVLLSAGTILILRKAAEVKNDLVFAILFFSFLVFQVTGFMAFPDSLLLFFTALFFLVYRQYSRSYSLSDGLILGLVMAGMFYSKYLGIFIVFFTFLSDLSLVKRKSFWLAVFTTTILFLPHLLWQYSHDFPSVYYHMLERSHDEYFRWRNFGEFIIGQFGQVNPLLFVPVLYFLFRFRTENPYDRSLKFSAIGCLFFPFIMMLKGRVEANWTMAGMVPLFIITYRMFENRPSFNRFLYIAGGFTFTLLLLARILLVYNFLPFDVSKKLKLDNYGWGELSSKISSIAGDRPVVFIGTYQSPSQYIFHTGKEAFTFNNAVYRGNQFDLEGIEQRLQGKEVLVVANKGNIAGPDKTLYNLALNDSILYPNGKYRAILTDTNYRSYNFIRAEVGLSDVKMAPGEIIEIPVMLINPGAEPVNFADASPAKVSIYCYFLKYGKPVITEEVQDLSSVILKDKYSTLFKIKAPAIPGTYYMKISLKSGWLPPGINSRLIKVLVE